MINKSIDELIDIYIELVLGSSDGHLVYLSVVNDEGEYELKRQVHRFTKYMFDRKKLVEEIKVKIYTDQSQGDEIRKSILISEIRDIKLKKIV